MSRVGVDLDGVIYDFEACLAEYFVRYQGWPRERCVTATQWELAKDWGISREEFVEACEDATEKAFMFVWGAPINDAREQLLRLDRASHSIHVITARDFGRMSQPNTRMWLDYHLIPYQTLDFSHSKTVRPLDYMIDDKPGNYEELECAGVVPVLQDRPYNRDFAAERRVASLEEFVDYVLEQEVGRENDAA